METALRAYTVNNAWVAGEEDRKFSEIAGEMADRIPRAELRIIPRSGHSIHLENPFAWLAAVRTFHPSSDKEADGIPSSR